MPVVNLLLVSGRSGSGKTSTTYELSATLRSLDIPHANVSADNLDDIYPDEEGAEMLLANLRAIWKKYHHSRGCTRLILSGTAIVIEAKAIRAVIEEICQETDPNTKVEVHSVVLTASDETSGARLQEREIGSGLERHIESSRKWSRFFDDYPDAHRVNTDGRSVVEVSNEVLEYIKWSTPRGST